MSGNILQDEKQVGNIQIQEKLNNRVPHEKSFKEDELDKAYHRVQPSSGSNITILYHRRKTAA